MSEMAMLRQRFRNIRRGYGLYHSCHKYIFHIPPSTLPFGEPYDASPNQVNRVLVGVGAFGLAHATEETLYDGQLVVCQRQGDNVSFDLFILVVSCSPSQNGGKKLL